MTWQEWLTIAVVTLTITALARDWAAPAFAVMGASMLLMLTGVITTQEALSGFSNPAPMTVAALFVVARAVEKTGALQPVLASTLGNALTPRRTLMRLLAPVAASSAVLNNTPIVAMLAPQVANWAQRKRLAPSMYLMPLSFATILGGTITAIGTSTNLVTSGLMEAAGMAPIGMFEITRIGVPLTIVGIIIIVWLAPRVLPDRRTARQQFEEHLREFVFQATVAARGALDGRTVEAAGLRNLEGVYLAELVRDGQMMAPVAPTTVLRGGDRLTFAGRVDLVRDLHTLRGLVPDAQKHAIDLSGPEHTFYEAVVSGASSLTGKTLKDVDFRSRYQAAVLGIHRAGQRVNEKLGSVRLREGDTLLLVSDHGFRARWGDRHDFLLVSHLGGTPPTSATGAILVGVITFAVVIVAGLGFMPILHSAMLGALLLVLTRVLSPSEARSAIELDVLVVIAAAFGIGAAIESSGLAARLGAGIVAGVSGFGPVAVLLAVVLATVVLTELITNNAAAVLLFPIGYAAAMQLGLDPRPFGIAIAVAASASFLTPIGYQTNAMVYGLGGYRFTDYIRLGLPLTIVVVITIVLVVPVFWPLQP